MRRPREILDGVFELRLGFVNVHLIVTDDGLVLVDTGLPGRMAKIEQALHEVRCTVGDIRTILLTHWHADHTGNVANLRRRSDAQVIAHSADVPIVSGSASPPPTPHMKVIATVTKLPEPSPVDGVIVGDGPTPVPDVTVIHTPGRTAGHVSFLLDRDGGVLFAGDAAAGAGRNVRNTPRMMSADPAMAARSVARLAGLHFETAVFGHGQAITGQAIDRFKDLAARNR